MRALRYFSDVNTSGSGPEWTRTDDLCVDGVFHLWRVDTYVTCRHDPEEGVTRLDGGKSPRRRTCAERLIADPGVHYPSHPVRVEQSFSDPWPCDGRCVRVGWDSVIVGAAVAEVRALLRASGGSVSAHLWARRFASAYHHREAHCSEFCVDQRVHVTRRYAEYGPQATLPAYENVRPCDGSCRPRTVRLSRQAQRLIERYDARMARPFAAADVREPFIEPSMPVRNWTSPPHDATWFQKLASWQTLGHGITDGELVRDLHARNGAKWLEVGSECTGYCVTIPIARIGARARVQELQAELGWLVWNACDEEPKTELLIRHPSDFGDEPWARVVCCRGRFDFIDGLWVHPLISERSPTFLRRAVEFLDLAPSVSVQSYVPYGHVTDEEIRAMVSASPAPPDAPIGEDTFSDG